ncbi:MAG: nascent polypeptide-associated complex protein [Candidatus Marsarchaeota archaeon]|nr:nascent polypeptide-associated complex protein [Candidatus Marsarchaeota archaeon]MCL5094631.1 nascent polypeptide-associated complex protein [Candidatus Marsarchaeota archaeon]
MMPNIDPKMMKSMMDRMGIKSSEISANRVIIECNDRDIIIENPEVMRIDMKGAISFQISGNESEKDKSVKLDFNEDDIKLIMEKTGINDKEKIIEELNKTNGDVALAIINLTE